ncbi:MAG: alpha/beta fold hydrolase [Ornithinimicrobium sp.]|uniref:alpha/beta fold hydrolase n=1 Tax=Ornithinimicrobium sp. TaxID=1977084 RepID=UPI003D9ADEA6
MVTTDDGVALAVDIDDPPGPASGPRPSGLTVVLAHGYTLDSRSWTLQRSVLQEAGHRVVRWDQRGHGRSDIGEPATHTIRRLGQDLREVLDAVVPQGPVLLGGHSMGAMALMSYAGRRREHLGERLRGMALVSTSVGGLDAVRWGLGERVGAVVTRTGPDVAAELARHPGWVDRLRRHPTPLSDVAVATSSFGSRVPRSVRRLTRDMILGTDPAVVASFVPTLQQHDVADLLDTLADLPALVIVGDRDVLTPPEHSARIAARLPLAEHVMVQRAGHILMLEHPEVVSEHLARLAQRCLDPAPAPPPRQARPRHTVVDLRPGRGRRAPTPGGGG